MIKDMEFAYDMAKSCGCDVVKFQKRTLIDLYYDPFIRSEPLIDVLRYYAENGDFPVESQESIDGETYFIIHPVLKHIAIGSSNG